MSFTSLESSLRWRQHSTVGSWHISGRILLSVRPQRSTIKNNRNGRRHGCEANVRQIGRNSLPFWCGHSFVSCACVTHVHLHQQASNSSSRGSRSSSSVRSLFVCARNEICLPKRPFNLSSLLITSCVFETTTFFFSPLLSSLALSLSL